MSVPFVSFSELKIVLLKATTYPHEPIAQQPELSLGRQIGVLEFDLGQTASHRLQSMDCNITLL